MIVRLKWTKALSVGDDKIDQQHRGLFSIVNDLINIHSQSSNHKEVINVLHAIVKYSEKHFITEDEYMTFHDYPQYSDHRKEHSVYLSNIKLFLEGYEKKQENLTMEMLKFLSKWWIDHVSESDMNYGLWIKSRKIPA